MKIQLKLLATFRKYLPAETKGYSTEIVVSAETCIDDLLTGLKIENNADYVILINGKTAADNQQLLEGDEVCIFPAMAGG
jgi:molybdopterin converting factor small subunit